MEAEDNWFAPHYAGVDAATVMRIVPEMGLDIKLPFEGFE